MIDCFYPSWPGPAVCPECKKGCRVYENPANQTVFVHEDAAVPDCRVAGGSPLRRIDASMVSFPLQRDAEFTDLEEAMAWGRRLVERRREEEVHVGYVHGHDGHRKIGTLRTPDAALATVKKEDDEVSVVIAAGVPESPPKVTTQDAVRRGAECTTLI
jgi:hypothetical protein